MTIYRFIFQRFPKIRRWAAQRNARLKDFPWRPEHLKDDPKERSLPSAAELERNKESATRLHRIYEAVSKNIERENVLINFRITWAIVLSGGILAAEGVIINYVAEYHAGDPDAHRAGQTAVVLLSMLAIYFCFMSFSGVKAAQRQMEHVKLAYRAYKNKFSVLGFPRPYGRKRNHRIGNYAAKVFPLALIGLWSFFLAPQSARLYALIVDPASVLSSFRMNRQSNEELRKRIDALSAQIDALQKEKPREQ